MLAQKYGFEFTPIPVTHPGVEQKSQWLAIRQNRPDYVLLWGWGVMNGTAIKEAAAVAYPRDRMIGVWWSGADAREAVKGLIVANSFLETDLEKLRAAVSTGYARGMLPRERLV